MELNEPELSEPERSDRTKVKHLSVIIGVTVNSDDDLDVQVQCIPPISLVGTASLLSAIAEQLRSGNHGEITITPIPREEES